MNNKKYDCSHCGFSPDNRSEWCALGCGRDYNEMKERVLGDTKLSPTAKMEPKDFGCHTENGILVCYCGKHQPRDYPLPPDFPRNPFVSNIVHAFREKIAELDDTNCIDTTKPFKGDIYFDGIELEAFLASSLESAIHEGFKSAANSKLDGLWKKAEEKAYRDIAERLITPLTEEAFNECGIFFNLKSDLDLANRIRQEEGYRLTNC